MNICFGIFIGIGYNIADNLFHSYNIKIYKARRNVSKLLHLEKNLLEQFLATYALQHLRHKPTFFNRLFIRFIIDTDNRFLC